MRLAGYKLYPYQLPLARPMAVRQNRASTRDGALLMVESVGGAMGWGDIAPLPGISAESLGEAVATARTRMDGLRNRDLYASDVLNRPPMRCPSAACGIDAAVLGCMAAEAGLSLGQVLADDVPAWVAVNALIDGEPDAAMIAAHHALSQGFRTLKLKVGRGDPVAEAAWVRRVRRELGEGITLRLDANRAWTLREARTFIDALGDTRIEYIEEPLRQPSGLAQLSVPIALDESLSEVEWSELGAVAAVIKPSIQDGLAGALRLARSARAHGLVPVVSSLFESTVGIRALAALASAVGEPDTAHGLDTLRWFIEDVAEPVPAMVGGRMAVDADSLLMLNPRVITSDLPDCPQL